LKVNFRQRHREFLFKNADIVLEISIELEDMVDLSRLLKSALVKRKKKEEMRERERERDRKNTEGKETERKYDVSCFYDGPAAPRAVLTRRIRREKCNGRPFIPGIMRAGRGRLLANPSTYDSSFHQRENSPIDKTPLLVCG
jgi:hypothetical protein